MSSPATNCLEDVCRCALKYLVLVRFLLGSSVSSVLLEFFEFLSNSRRWVLVPSSRLDCIGNAVPLLCLELVFDFLLDFKKGFFLFIAISPH
jgi:hypothetical protein